MQMAKGMSNNQSAYCAVHVHPIAATLGTPYTLHPPPLTPSSAHQPTACYLYPTGAGNTPAVIDETANVQMAVSSVLLSKTFDNGVICASEQSVVVVEAVYEAVKAEMIRRGAYFLNEEEKAKVGVYLVVV